MDGETVAVQVPESKEGIAASAPSKSLKRRREVHVSESEQEGEEEEEEEDDKSEPGTDLQALTEEAVRKHHKAQGGSVKEQPLSYKDWRQKVGPLTQQLNKALVDFENSSRKRQMEYEKKRREEAGQMHDVVDVVLKHLHAVDKCERGQSFATEAIGHAEPVDFMSSQINETLDQYHNRHKRDRSKETVVEVFQQVVLAVSRHMIEKHMSEAEQKDTAMLLMSEFTTSVRNSTPASGRK